MPDGPLSSQSTRSRADAFYGAGEAFWEAAESLGRASKHLGSIGEQAEADRVRVLVSKIEGLARGAETSGDGEMEALA